MNKSVVVAQVLFMTLGAVNYAKSQTTGLGSVQTVFVILMENHNWADIENSPRAPYINNQLLPIASYAKQYYNVPGLHPSLPNYLWLEAGDNFGVYADGPPRQYGQVGQIHLTQMLDLAGLSWKSYQEDIAGDQCPLDYTGLYAVHHNPMVYFDDVTGGGDPGSAYCIQHVRPFRELQDDLNSGQVASYNFITPNICNDMHEPAPDCGIEAGDSWLSAVAPMIMASTAYQNGGALFIVWDEGENGSDGPIGMIVLSPFANGGGYTNQIPYTHSSYLRTIQNIFGLSPYLGDAANATDLSDLFAFSDSGDPSAPLRRPVSESAVHRVAK